MLYAALYGDLATIKQSTAFSIIDWNGRTPLHVAASEGYLEIS